MKFLYTSLFIYLLACLSLSAQEKAKAFGIKFKGFVNYEMIYDSRQVVAARDGNVLLYPSPVNEDPNGQDLNAVSQFNAFAITTRLQGVISGPDALGAKTSGMISGDFFGTANDKIGLFRLRQAFVKLSWENSDLLVGKAWHPLFVTEVFPKVLSFGAGIPIYPLSRAPQLSYTLKGKQLSMTLAVSAQQDFAALGPNGRSPSYLMNTGLPELNTRLVYKTDRLLMGAAAGFWKLKPQLETATGFQTKETVNGWLLNSFAKLSLKNTTFRGGYLYGSNMSQFLMFGGYGVSEVEEPTQIEKYRPTTASSLWADLDFKKGAISMGIFGGYTQNHGADQEMAGAVYAMGANIDHYLRVAPRIAYTSGKVRIGLEAIYHVAAYGTPDERYQVVDTNDVDALRILSSVVYSF